MSFKYPKAEKRFYGYPPENDFPEDVSKAVTDLQKEVDTLRGIMDDFDKDNIGGVQMYETIHPKNRYIGYAKPHTGCSHNAHKSASSRGLHHVALLLDPQASNIRRLLWVLTILICATLLTYQILDRVSLFRSNDVTISTEVKFPQRLAFPAVTICNLNKFRITEVVKSGFYREFSDYMSRLEPDYRKPRLRHLKPPGQSCTDFLSGFGHSVKTLVYRCTWNGEECNWRNFTEVTTEYGVCHTFSVHDSKQWINNKGRGLSLLLNVEQYEYMQGPRLAVGVKVAVHDKDDIPRMWLEGVNAAVGSHTTVSLNKVKNCEITTKSSWGILSLDEPNCQKPRCVSRNNLCDVFADSSSRTNDQLNYCDRRGGDFDVGTVYEITLSHSSLSSYAAESEVRVLAREPQLYNHFVHSLDSYHRANSDIYSYDNLILDRLVKGYGSVQTNVAKSLNATRTYNDEYQVKFRDITQFLQELYDRVTKSLKVISDFKSLSFIRIPEEISRSFKNLRQTSKLDLTASETDSKLVLQNVLDELKRLAISRDLLKGQKGETWLQKDIKEIDRFRNDIVNSAEAQQFSELRQNQIFYDKTTREIYKLSNKLLQFFVNHYNKINDFVNKPPPSTEYPAQARDLLSQFENQMEQVEIQTIPDLRKQCDRLDKTFETHRLEIQAFYRKLSDSRSYVVNLSSFVNKVTSSLRHLDENVMKLNNKLINVRKQYRDIKSKKSVLSKSFSFEGLWKASVDIKERPNSVLKLLNEMILSNRRIFQSAKQLLPRLSDFDLPETHHITLLLDDSLKDSPLLQTKDDLEKSAKDLVTLTLLVQEYTEDLQEYLDSLKIDHKFFTNNFMRLDVVFSDLQETITLKRPAYGIIDFTCDLGGTVALYFGASVLTILECVGFLFHIVTLVSKNSKGS